MKKNITIAFSACACFCAGLLIAALTKPSTRSSPDAADAASTHQKSVRLSIGSRLDRKHARPGIQLKADASHPIMMLEEILHHADPIARTDAWLTFIGTLAPSQFEALLVRMGQGYFHENSGEYQMLLSAWAKADPAAALEWAARGSGYDLSQVQNVLRSLATTDPDAAIQWVKDHPMGNGTQSLMAGVISGIAATDLARATELLNDMPPSRDREKALLALLTYGPQLDRVAALEWAATIEDEEVRSSALSQLMDDISRRDPKGTLEWLLKQPGKSHHASVEKVMEHLTKQDPETAQAHFRKIQDEDMKRNAFTGITNQLGKQDVKAALQFIEANPSLATDFVYQTLAFHSVTCDPEQGAKSISNIKSQQVQGMVYDSFFSLWLMADTNAATAWYQKQTLPDGIKRSMDSELERHKVFMKRSNYRGHNSYDMSTSFDF
jgi:hypothetical protein